MDNTKKLIMVDTYDEFSEHSNVLYEREFLIYQNDMVIAPKYWVSSECELSYLSMCKYSSSGSILNYRTMLNYSNESVAKNEKEIECSEFYAEDYQYDLETGLLCRVQHGNKHDKYVWESCYQFSHDEEGHLTSFQQVITNANGNEMYGNTFEIPKSKRRIV